MPKPAKQPDLGAQFPVTESNSGMLDLSARQMNEADYASLERMFGANIVCKGRVYWQRVRPFFYRPLIPFEPMDVHNVMPPCNWPVGYQYGVLDPLSANSTINFLVCDEPHGYSLEALGHNRRRLIKAANKSFQIRPIVDVGELKEQGHKAYLSFHRRTGYAYKRERASRAGFDRWVDTLGKYPKAIVLGGYGPDGLTAVSVSYWVRDSLWYASLFSETASLKAGVCELMLHELRQIVAAQQGIARIVARPYRGGNNLDQYYLIRGFKVARIPARLEISSVLMELIQRFLPRHYATLCGHD